MGALDGTSPARGPTLAGAGAASAFRPKAETRALTSSQPVPANFRSRPPALSCGPALGGAQGDPQRRRPRPPLATPFPFIRFGPRAALPRAPGPGALRGPRYGWARSSSAATPREAGAGRRAGQPRDPARPPPTPAPGGVRKRGGRAQQCSRSAERREPLRDLRLRDTLAP